MIAKPARIVLWIMLALMFYQVWQFSKSGAMRHLAQVVTDLFV